MAGDLVPSKRVSRNVADDLNRTIGVACETRLYSVDDVAETFHVGMLIHTHFTDRSVTPDPKASDEFVRVPSGTYTGYMPHIIIVNVVDDGNLHEVVRINYHTGDVWVSFQGVAHIHESLELQKFPFDRQLFRVSFKSPNAQFDRWRLSVEHLDFPNEFVNGKIAKDRPNESAFLVSCELNTWRIAGITVGIHTDDPDPVSLTSFETTLIIRAERDPLFFLCNFVLIIYIIVLLNAASVAISVEDMGDRLAYSSSLLLTAVAFKFVLADTLPKVGYQTIMDIYVLIAFLFIGVGALEHLVASPSIRCFWLNYDDASLVDVPSCVEDATIHATRFDGMFQLAYVLLWSAVNLGCLLAAIFPQIIRPTWASVMNNQVGEAWGLRRTNVIEDLDNEIPGATIA